MPRAALFFLLVAGVLGGSAQAQRALGHAARQPAHSGFGGQRGLNRFFPRRRFLPNGVPRYDALGSYFVPYDEPFGYGYEQPYSEGATHEPVPQLVTLAAPEPPVPKGQLIEIPQAALGVVVMDYHIDQRHITVVSHNNRLGVTLSRIDRQRRNVPLDMLDINATINTNHDRGIDLRIPDDRNEISVSF